MKTFGIFIISLGLLVAGLITRHQSAVFATSLATQIVGADANNVSPTALIQTERDYVSRHMGASVAFELKGAYARAQEAAQAAAQPQVSGDIYSQAQAACSGLKNPVKQAQCNQNYLNSHLTTAQATPVPTPVESNYAYSMTSPIWTPDLTGYLWLLSIIGFVAIAGRLILHRN